MAISNATEGCKITINWGHTRVTGEALTVDGVDDHTWWFDNAPVGTKNLRLIGTFGGETEFIVNYDLEPITGRLTVDAALPAYTAISADYYYYLFTLEILTQNFKVEFPKPIADIDIWGQPHYQIHNNYPHKLDFRMVLTGESQRNLLTESMFNAFYFMVLDKNFDATFGLRAYEGPLWSDEQSSISKGMSYLLPIELFVQQFGAVKLTTTGAITSTADPGGGLTTIAVAGHDLATGQWVVITDTTFYDGTWRVTVVDIHNFTIETAFAGNDTGTMTRPEQITWGFWEQ